MGARTVHTDKHVAAVVERVLTRPVLAGYVVHVESPVPVTGHLSTFWLKAPERPGDLFFGKYTGKLQFAEATKYRTRRHAEAAVVMLTANNPNLIGKCKIWKINLVPERLNWVVRGVGKRMV